MAAIASPAQVLASWFGEPGAEPAVRPAWFRKDPAFDDVLRAAFLPTVEAAARGGLEDWTLAHGALDPQGTLALVLVCDQFPRNLFRGSPRAFALDARALALARRLVDAGADRALAPLQRWFAYLPFEHAEDLGAQRESLRLFGQLRDDPLAGGAWDWAVRHHDVIARFGRFPHRNDVLGRASTPQELDFLRQPGSRF